ncbi:hypothetical protein OB955_11070 [Halobacteria archaeon AArc-m2/3/4]|uniref:DUF7344 domain-containing protein n=1 Tax=Natronoglomus mannanivorans TaxID=2979990 RepID=A0ABT2QEC6_9EURY|nr:hypothetical protein [Halobacteria archaeon AArc-m2/3/4]
MGKRRPVRSSQSSAESESPGGYLDAVFDALAASRRQLVVVVLYRSDRTAVETLARKITELEREFEREDDEIDEGAVDRRETRNENRNRTGEGEQKSEIQTALRHVHLPKLEDAQLIEWDRRDDVVSLVEDRRTGDLERQLVRDVATRQFDRRVA